MHGNTETPPTGVRIKQHFDVTTFYAISCKLKLPEKLSVTGNFSGFLSMQ